MDHLYFLREYGVFICRRCQFAVRRKDLRSHFKNKKLHQLSREALDDLDIYIQDTLQALPEGVMEIVPVSVPEPLAHLPLWRDGVMCQAEPQACRYICRNEHVMKRHCRVTHRWSNPTRRGRPQALAPSQQDPGQNPWRPVWCQRLFISGSGSHFFEVLSRPSGLEATEDFSLDIARQVRHAREAARQSMLDTIQEANPRESSPWIIRAGWSRHLRDLDRADLLASTAIPTGSERTTEQVTWQAVFQLLQRAEVTATEKAGIFIRQEIVRTPDTQRSPPPLQPYQDRHTLARNCRYWRQIVLFFVRTQEQPSPLTSLYTLTSRQQQIFDRFYNEVTAFVAADGADDDDDNESSESQDQDEDLPDIILSTCLDFCLSLLEQSSRENEYECALLTPLAVLGLSDNGWDGPREYTTKLSGVIKTSRYLIIQYILTSDSPNPLREIKEMMARFFRRGTSGPYDWMVELRAYGLKITFSEMTPGNVSWLDDEVLLYRDLQFSMPEFRSFVHGLVHDLEAILHQELLFSRVCRESIPSLSLRDLRDDHSNGLPLWSFLRDPRSRFPVQDGDQWLLNRVLSNSNLRPSFFPSVDASSVPPRVNNYFQRVDDFQAKLWVLVHITAGQPARGTELLTVRYQNTQTAPRNIFLDSSLIMIVSDYHKRFSVSGQYKIIHRFLPSCISLLVVQYLWLVLPFIEQLQVRYFPQRPISVLLWPSLIPKRGEKEEYRSDSVREALQRESLSGLGQKLDLQPYRHIAISISRRFLQDIFQFSDLPQGMEDIDDHDDIFDLQAAHSSRVAGSVYARGIQERSNTTWRQREQFRQASLAWHRLLGFQTPESLPVRHKRQASSIDDGRRQRWLSFRKLQPLVLLRRLYGESAVFRPMQEEALRAILDGVSPILAVMPTGAGKSLFFFLPAIHEESGMSIVVVPLISLRKDLVRRCEEHSISCREWNPSNPGDDVKIVVVTIEATTTPPFLNFLNRLRTMGRLDRIYIDECHVILEHTDFRPKILSLCQFSLMEVPLVFCTATLPPSRESEFWSLLLLTGSRPAVFRTGTSRPNIGYSVVQLPPDDVENYVRQQIEGLSSGRVLIYCLSVRETRSLADRLGYSAYYRDAENKDEVIRLFSVGDKQVMVCTNALSLGFDLPDIRLVIHTRPPRTVLDFVQESGRIGRDGLAGRSVLIRRLEERLEDATMGEFILPVMESRCRRAVLDGYLDRREDRLHCSTEEVLCDVCSRGSTRIDVQAEASADEQARQRQYVRTAALQAIRDQTRSDEQEQAFFLSLAGQCLLCRSIHGEMHPAGDCGHPNRAEWRGWGAVVRTKIQYERYTACFRCGLPQSWCQRWTARPDGGWQEDKGAGCQHPDLISEAAPIFFFLHPAIEDVQQKLFEYIGTGQENDIDEIVEVLGKRASGIKGLSRLVRGLCFVYNLLLNS